MLGFDDSGLIVMSRVIPTGLPVEILDILTLCFPLLAALTNTCSLSGARESS